MNSTRFIEIAQEVSTKTLTPELVQLIKPLIYPSGGNISLQPIRDKFIQLVFNAREAYYNLAQDSEISEVMNSLGYTAAFDANLVSRLLHSFHSNGDLETYRKNLFQTSDLFFFYFRLESLLTFIRGLNKLIVRPRNSGVGPEEAAIAFEVLDLGQTGFSFERLEEIFPIIHKLYNELCRLYDVSDTSLRLLYLDSGSPLIVCIKGDGKIIDAIRKLFIAIWDKVRFRKLDDFERKLESFDKTFEVLEKINSKRDEGVITSEDALRFSHLIATSACELLSKGANLREIQKTEHLNNRALLMQTVETKYLTAGNSNDAEPSTDTPPEDGETSLAP